MRRITTTLLALAGTLAAAGCSATASTSNPSGTAQNYFHDLGNQDYQAACGLLTDQLRQQLGDCPTALPKRHQLSRDQRDELTQVSVRLAIPENNGKATVTTMDVRIQSTVTVKVKINGTATPSPRSSALRSLAANFATDGHGLELTKMGGIWRISGGGV